MLKQNSHSYHASLLAIGPPILSPTFVNQLIRLNSVEMLHFHDNTEKQFFQSKQIRLGGNNFAILGNFRRNTVQTFERKKDPLLCYWMQIKTFITGIN